MKRGGAAGIDADDQVRTVGGARTLHCNGRVRQGVEFVNTARKRGSRVVRICDHVNRRRRPVNYYRLRIERYRGVQIVAAIADYARNAAPIIVRRYKAGV